MKMVLSSILVLVVTTLASLSAIAGSDEKIRKFATEYHTSKALREFETSSSLPGMPLLQPSTCEPTQPSRAACFNTVCNKLGSYQCDQQSEIQRVGRICASQYDGSCIEKVCTLIGSFQCDEFRELEQVALSCRDVIGGSCLNEVCNRIGSYRCDEQREISVVGQMCRGTVDAGCIKNVCDRLGSFQCDEVSELQAVINSCKGL